VSGENTATIAAAKVSRRGHRPANARLIKRFLDVRKLKISLTLSRLCVTVKLQPCHVGAKNLSAGGETANFKANGVGTRPATVKFE
jgi:hypothetical protein